MLLGQYLDVKFLTPESSDGGSPGNGAAPSRPEDVTADAESSTASSDVQPDSSTGEETQESGRYDSPDAVEQTALHKVVREAAQSEDDGAERTTDREGDADTDTDTDTATTAEAETSEKQGEAEGETRTEGEDDNGEDVAPGQRVPYERFKSVIDERNQTRQQLQELEPRAQEYDRITGFMQEHDLGADEVARAFRFLALSKTDPAAAREELSGYMQSFDQFTGHVLPSDLQQEVEDSYITEERAQEVAKLRNQSQFERTQAERHRQQAEQERQQARQTAQQRQAAQVVQAMRSTVAEAEQQAAQNDPDYQRMQPWVVKEMRLLMQDDPPRTPEDANKLFQQAYGNVKEGLRGMMPQRRELRPSATSAHAGRSGSARPEPKSLVDAALQAANETTT